MPKQGYCAAIFYNGDETIASVEILPTQEAKHLVLASKVGVEKRNFKVYRLGSLLAKCVREPASGPTPHAPNAAWPPNHRDEPFCECSVCMGFTAKPAAPVM